MRLAKLLSWIDFQRYISNPLFAPNRHAFRVHSAIKYGPYAVVQAIEPPGMDYGATTKMNPGDPIRSSLGQFRLETNIRF